MFMRIHVDADKGYFRSRVVFSSFKSNPPVDANDEFENYPGIEVMEVSDCVMTASASSFVKCQPIRHRPERGKVADVSQL